MIPAEFWLMLGRACLILAYTFTFFVFAIIVFIFLMSWGDF